MEIDKCADRLKKRMLNSDNSLILEQLKCLKEIMYEEDWDQIIEMISYDIANIYNEEKKDIEKITDIDLVEFLKDICDNMLTLSKSLTIKVELQDLDDEFYRTIVLPYSATLSDLACIILASFKVSGDFIYAINDLKKIYYCKPYLRYAEEDVLMANDTYLPDLNLEKGSHLELQYDLDNPFVFNITIQSMNQTHRMLVCEESQIIEGKGYGIWEYDHDMMYLYYTDYLTFRLYVRDDMDAKIKEFDLKSANDKLIHDFHFLKYTYKEE